MIKISNLNVKLEEKTIIENFSFELAKGETLVVMGKNGSGKSVLLKTIAGLINRTSGDIIINGQNLTYDGNSGVFPENIIGYVFQKGGLFDSIDVFNNVAFGLRRRGLDSENIEKNVMASLESVGLVDAAHKFPSELSGGMQKRVGLARAVSLGTGIILYDDPTAGLDPILSDAIADLINDITRQRNVTSIVATHDLKVAEKVADYVVLIYTGKAVFCGPAGDFFTKSDGFARQFIEGDIEGPIDVFKL